jgi:hypothetical protein
MEQLCVEVLGLKLLDHSWPVHGLTSNDPLNRFDIDLESKVDVFRR